MLSTVHVYVEATIAIALMVTIGIITGVILFGLTMLIVVLTLAT